MNNKKRKMGSVLGIIGSSCLLFNSFIQFVSIANGGRFDINTFSAFILAILGIVFCSISCSKKSKMLLVAYIFTGINAALSIMVIFFYWAIGATGGILCYLGIFALIYAFVLFHSCYYAKDDNITITNNVPNLSPVEEMKKLQELKDKNLISEEEFERRKDNIILKL